MTSAWLTCLFVPAPPLTCDSSFPSLGHIENMSKEPTLPTGISNTPCLGVKDTAKQSPSPNRSFEASYLALRCLLLPFTIILHSIKISIAFYWGY
ncbi:hypothetical protein B0T21DRAFT_366448 [Apiosordaria backusii]|uniref:Uncharacterized protein n=1 Tax=Apiosordaria backusii TaxID=314023 RepID=A0AA40BL16_9PEZI|nr:hypothetical protein B0T21DRAFT_366448 [Apiosordaria backusii]